jgi:hypothetical protein
MISLMASSPFNILHFMCWTVSARISENWVRLASPTHLEHARQAVLDRKVLEPWQRHMMAHNLHGLNVQPKGRLEPFMERHY